jgi:hypothetical protein
MEDVKILRDFIGTSMANESRREANSAIAGYSCKEDGLGAQYLSSRCLAFSRRIKASRPVAAAIGESSYVYAQSTLA